jgi:transcriptional regulator with XRE-family HTH domain
VNSSASSGADELRRTLGDNVRRLRRERGLSQRALANFAGISTQHIGWIEAGRANVRSTTLANLAAALEVEAVVLLSRQGG